MKFILQGNLPVFLTKTDNQIITIIFYKMCPKERGKALLNRNDSVANAYYYWKGIVPVH